MSVDSQLLGAPYGAATRNPFNYVKFEQIGRDVVTPWLTLDEITNQINLFQDESQDGYLQALELAVRQAIEDYCLVRRRKLSQFARVFGFARSIAKPIPRYVGRYG